MIRHWLPVGRHVPLFFEVAVEDVRDVAEAEGADGRPADGVDGGAEGGVDQVVQVVLVAFAVSGLRAVPEMERFV